MSHPPITFKNVSLVVSKTPLFSDLNTTIYPHSRIAIIGDNGSGKSSLLRMLNGIIPPTDGVVSNSQCTIGYVSQNTNNPSKSGGEAFQEKLTHALSNHPDILILDEPTNHLDVKNRRQLMRFIQKFNGTVITATHDIDLIDACFDTIWDIYDGRIHNFCGEYDDYKRQKDIQRQHLLDEDQQLRNAKKSIHESRMREQVRVAKSRKSAAKKVENRKWMKSVSDMKANTPEKSQGQKQKNIEHQRQHIATTLQNHMISEIIPPTFIVPHIKSHHHMCVAVQNGAIRYDHRQKYTLENINLSVESYQRVAIIGDNGSGKTTLIRGFLNDDSIHRTGSWVMPNHNDIGYLDQNYGNLRDTLNVFETIQNAAPHLNDHDIRGYLNTFLFQKNEDISKRVHHLSGGERARLALAVLAIKPTNLLILDEITNNIDMITRDHVISVLRNYPGAMMVISHDAGFLRALNIHDVVNIHDFSKKI